MRASLSEIINELEKLETPITSAPTAQTTTTVVSTAPVSATLTTNGRNVETRMSSSSGGGSSVGEGGVLSDAESVTSVGGGGPGSFESRLLRQNKDMLKTIKSLQTEKSELKNLAARLEEEIWTYKNKYKNEINSLTEHDREKVCRIPFLYSN